MKENGVNLTLQETEQLCRLYMECRLTVLEETELQYVLGKLPYSSPCIDEVRMLMGIPGLRDVKVSSKRRFGRFNRKLAIGIAASIALLFAVGFSIFHNVHEASEPFISNEDDCVYIAAYSHGKRLNGDEAIGATNIAMAKADSLMKYASLAERNNLLKANYIISETVNN